MAEEIKRFDNWPPIIPKVGQVVQIQLGEDIVEVAIAGRATADKETFSVWFTNPWMVGNVGKIVLQITPEASARGMVDRANNRKPYWRIVPNYPDKEFKAVNLYFVD